MKRDHVFNMDTRGYILWYNEWLSYIRYELEIDGEERDILKDRSFLRCQFHRNVKLTSQRSFSEAVRIAISKYKNRSK